MNPEHRTKVPTAKADEVKGTGDGLFFDTNALVLRRFKDQRFLVHENGKPLKGHIIRDENKDYRNPEVYMNQLSPFEKNILTGSLAKAGLPMSVIENRFEAQKRKADRPARRFKVCGLAKTY